MESLIKKNGYTWKLSNCEICQIPRYIKYSVKLNKFYNYKSKCKKCTLTERNKRQNFSPRKYPVKDYFEIIDTPAKSYIFGFLWADGCLYEQKRSNKISVKSVRVCMQARDAEVIDFFVSIIGGRKKLTTTYDKRNTKTYEQVLWMLNSKRVHENLVNLNFRKNIHCVPPSLHSHFMRGLIDGDGCYRLKNNILREIKISSEYDQDWSFLSAIKEIKQFSVLFDVGKKGRGSNFMINGTHQDRIEFLKWLYGNLDNFYLKRKYNKIKDEILRSSS